MMKKIFLIFTAFLIANPIFADTIKFVQVSDVHFPQRDYLSYEGRDLSFAITNYEKAIKQINSDKDIQAVFFTGDFTDRSLEEVYLDFFKTTKKLNKNYYLAFGNHDVNSVNGLNKLDAISLIKKKTENFKNNGNYTVNLDEKIIAIILDGALDTEMSAMGKYSNKTLNWLDEELKMNKDKLIIIFQHFPIVAPEKDKKYINSHKTINKWKYSRIIKKYNNILFIASGHYHVAGDFEKYGTKHFSTPALFQTPSFYREFNIDYNKNQINKIESKLIEIK